MKRPLIRLKVVLLTLLFSLVLNVGSGFWLSGNSLSAEGSINDVIPAVVQIGVSQHLESEINTVGSGVIVTKEGYVLTVKHNVVGYDHIFVKLSDGTPFKVMYYVADAHRDLVVLKIETRGKKLPVAKLGDSEAVHVGQEVYTIGYPTPTYVEDDNPTVAKGIISAINRVLSLSGSAGEDEFGAEIENEGWLLEYGSKPDKRNPLNVVPVPLIQFDAMINPGSSGGPLVTVDGQVVGLVQSMITNTGATVGMNFAIPVSWARLILSEKEAIELR